MSSLWAKVSVSSFQLLSHVWLFATPWTAVRQASLSITNSQSLLKLMSIKLVIPSNHLILYHPLLLLPSVFPSIRVFSNESLLHIRWPKYWSFNFGISPSNEYSGLISLWFDCWISLQSKGLSSVFSNTTVQKHQFFMVHLTHPHLTTGKTIALTRRTSVGKVMSLLFNMLFRLVQRYMCLLNIWHRPLGPNQATPEGLTLGMKSRRKIQTVKSIKTKDSSFVFESAFYLWLQPQFLAKYLPQFLTLLGFWWPMTILSHRYLHS